MYLLAFDLGTGGLKTSLFDENLNNVFSLFTEYETYYPRPLFHEQKPSDWWNAVVTSAKEIRKYGGITPESVACIALSGSSLVPVLLDAKNRLLSETVPIWSDKRAENEARDFFATIDENEWYTTTGNGFPAACYPLFKLLWHRKHRPELYRKTAHVLGSKDYINYLLTGTMATDYSYASGSGFYSLTERKYCERYLQAADIPLSLFPAPIPSHAVIGNLTSAASDALGLTKRTKVVCGGVDNACMALGAVGNTDKKAYVSLGSSTWIPVNTRRPLLDIATKPYTFAHLDENLFTSAYSIFSGGNSLRWLRDTVCAELPKETAYDLMCEAAKASPVGANGVMFHPALAGGTHLDKSQHIRGGFFGLTLATRKSDVIRATLEGIAFNLRLCLDRLQTLTPVEDEICFFGGGSKNDFWLSIFSDIFEHTVVRTTVEQDTASLGAAAAALRGIGNCKDYSFITGRQKRVFTHTPNKENVVQYKKLLPLFCTVGDMASEYGQSLYQINRSDI